MAESSVFSGVDFSVGAVYFKWIFFYPSPQYGRGGIRFRARKGPDP